tara:strand:- start:4131 stop:5093 length:963 start_codon:yes stop_codon:yes gene_type:complete
MVNKLSTKSIQYIFDRSYLGIYELRGNDSLDLLNRLSSNKVDDLSINHGESTILTNNKGKVIDVVTLFKLDSKILMLTSSNNSQEVIDWIDTYTFIEDISVANTNSEFNLITLIGDNWSKYLVQKPTIDKFTCESLEVEGNNCLIMRTDPTGHIGYDLLIPANNKNEIINFLSNIKTNIEILTEYQYDYLRINEGIPRLGKEINENFNPWEINLNYLINMDKGCYIGQEVILRLNTYEKIQKYLKKLSIKLEDHASNTNIKFEDKNIGIITSVDNTNKIGLGVINKRYCEDGKTYQLVNENSELIGTAEILETELPNSIA